MDNAQSIIQTYDTGFIICIAIGVLALIAATAMFFLFDIRTNFAIRTGRAQKLAVKKLQQKNEKTDPLAQKAVPVSFPTEEAKGEETAPLTTAPAVVAPTEPTLSEQRKRAVKEINFTITEDTVVIHTGEVI